MSSAVAEHIVSVMSTIIPTFVDSAMVEERPYAVYNLVDHFVNTKFKSYLNSVSATIYVVANSYDSAEQLATSVANALVESSDNEMKITPDTYSFASDDNKVWTFTLNFEINVQ